MMITRLVLVALLVVAAPAAAQPGATGDAVARLAAAAQAVDAKQWEQVLVLAGGIPDDPAVTTADRGEAHRLLGIAEFHLGRYDRAEAHFHAYLKIDLDGQLDIALHSPDVVRFFDDVKAKHAAELRAMRPRTRRWAVLNLMPPAGQFQNRQPIKGWVLGGLGVTLLAAHLGSYMMLENLCSDADLTCEDADGTTRSGRARTLKNVNAAAGVALIGIYVYGVYDGFRNYRRTTATVTVTPVAMTRGAGIGISGVF